MSEAPATTPPAPGHPETAPSTPLPTAASAFRRLAGHLRLAAAGTILMLKLSGFLALLLVWFGMTDELRVGSPRTNQILLGALMCGSIFAARLLAGHVRPLLVTSATFCVYAAALVVPKYVDQVLREVGPPPGYVLAALLSLAGGAIIGHFLFSLTDILARKLDCPPAVGHLLPTFGHSRRHGDYRASFDDALLHAFTAYASFLRGVRSVLFAGGMMYFVLLSFVWAAEGAGKYSAERWHFWSETDVAIWLGISFVAAVVLAVPLLPAGKRQSSLSISLGILICMSLGAGVAIFLGPSKPTSALLPLVQVILASAAIGLPACAASQFVFGFMIRRILPAPIRRHLLPLRLNDDAAPPAEHHSAMCCEQCGYALDGLPVTKCDRCAIEELRCPECGHQQPAGVLHARAIRTAHKMHLGVRVVSWLVGIGLVITVLMPWFGVGAFSGSGAIVRVNLLYWREVVGVIVMCALSVLPLRLVLLHWSRPTWLTSVITGLLPLAAIITGVSLSGRDWNGMGDVIRFFLPGWVVGAFATPLLWELWLRVLYGDSGWAAYRWQQSSAYRHPSAEAIASDPDGVAGSELPLRCGACDAEMAHAPAAQCPACGVNARVCVCSARRPISAVRIAFECMAQRARHMVLALIAAQFAAAVAICGFCLMVFGALSVPMSGYETYRQLLGTSIASLIWGGLLRAAMIRRNSVTALGAVLSGHLLVFLVLPLLIQSNHALEMVDGEYAVSLLVAMVCAAVGALIAAPLLQLLATALLPAPHARAVMDFLRARVTLDEAAARLP